MGHCVLGIGVLARRDCILFDGGDDEIGMIGDAGERVFWLVQCQDLVR